MTFEPENFLQTLFEAAVRRADPRRTGALDPLLDQLRREPEAAGRTLVVGAGKASAAFALALEAAFEAADRKIDAGLLVCPVGARLPTRVIELVEASHPVPDNQSQRAANRILDLVSDLTADDHVIVVLSGGGSSLLAAPTRGISLDEKTGLTQALLKSGAPIGEINCVRKHLSAIKGGRLAAAAFPARMTTLAISDVVGDDFSIIASGPTTADPTTLADALAILVQYDIAITEATGLVLGNPVFETPKPGDRVFGCATSHLVARPADALTAAIKCARTTSPDYGIPDLSIHDLGCDVEGNAADIAGRHYDLAMALKAKGGNHLILSGGELTVKLPAGGNLASRKGGPNHEYILALLNHLKGENGIYGLAADTDGLDGTSDAAGARLSPTFWDKARKSGLDPVRALAEHRSGDVIKALGAELVTGPTHTNVNDFRAILIRPECGT